MKEGVETGIGRAYALSKGDAQTLRPGDKMLVVRKDRYRSSAEGKLVKLEPTSGWVNRLQRFDAHIEGLEHVEFRPCAYLNRYEVLVVV